MSALEGQRDHAILVYITTPNRAEALRIGQRVVEKRLAACANIVPAIDSLYWWEGRVQTDTESLLLLKSRASLAEELIRTVAELHPYTVPAICVINLDKVHAPYLEWLVSETRAAES